MPRDYSSRAPSAYEVLGVPSDADQAELKAAWRRAARRTHPDHGGDGEEFRRVSAAWALVGDPESRRAYDRQLVDGGAPGESSGSRGEGRTAGARRGPASGSGGRGRRGVYEPGARGPGRWSPGWRPPSRPDDADRDRGTGRDTAVRYLPSLADDGPDPVLDAARSHQVIHGVPRKRGILPAGSRLRREERTIRVLQQQVLSALPAARLVNGLQLTAGRVTSGPIDHVVLCGDRLAVVGSLQVPDGAYRWDGAELWAGTRPTAPPSLAPAMVTLQRSFPECTVGGFVLVLAPGNNPHTPVIQLDRSRSLDTEASYLTDPPANALQFGRDLKMFLGTGPHASVVDRRVLARLLGTMY